MAPIRSSIASHLLLLVAVVLATCTTPAIAKEELNARCIRSSTCESNKCILGRCRCNADSHCGTNQVCDQSDKIHRCRDKKRPGEGCSDDSQCDYGCAHKVGSTCGCTTSSQCDHLSYSYVECKLVEVYSPKVCIETYIKTGYECQFDWQCLAGYCKNRLFRSNVCCTDASGSTDCSKK